MNGCWIMSPVCCNDHWFSFFINTLLTGHKLTRVSTYINVSNFKVRKQCRVLKEYSRLFSNKDSPFRLSGKWKDHVLQKNSNQ